MAVLLLALGALGLLLAGGSSGGSTTAAAIPPDEVSLAYRTALATEKDPAQLRAFADSLLPDFPAYAAALTKKADTLS